MPNDETLPATEYTLLPKELDSTHYHLHGQDASSGGSVLVHVWHGANELQQNLEVAWQLMRRGERIVLLETIKGLRTADATRNGVEWEFKRLSNAKNIPRAIEKAVLQKKGQACRFVLHIMQPYSNSQLTNGLYKIVCNSAPADFQEIALLFADGRLVSLSRQEIENKNFEKLGKK